MADFTKLQLKSPDAAAAADETRALLSLAQIDLEQKRVAVTRRATNAMMAVTVVLTVFVIAITIALTITLQQMRAALDSVAASVGPDAVATAVNTIQASLENTHGSTQNIFELTANAEKMGERMIGAVNTTVEILATTNQLASNLMAHPQISMTLGQPAP